MKITFSPELALAATAAQEILAHLGLLAQSAPIDEVTLNHDGAPEGEGFSWQLTGRELTVHGAGPRGLLYGVYDFLEACGFAWPAPSDVYLVKPEHFAPRAMSGRSDGPALPGRSLIIGHHAFMAEAEDWMVWAARNRLNTIFFHTAASGLSLGAVPDAQWRKKQTVVTTLARMFGLKTELGGHGLAALLPRDLFAEHPDYFRMKDGFRDAQHNLNPLSEGALKIVRRNARRWFAENSGMDVYHLWADDLADGGWCAGAAAQGFSPADQLMLVTNAVAEELEALNPAALVSFLAYHDTESVAQKVKPRANVAVAFAPRLRCYTSGLDAGHEVNARYPEIFRSHAEAFGARSPRLRVFEYYLDAILFKLAVPPLLGTMQDDLRFYAEAGAHTVGALLTGSMPFPAPHINAWAFAKLCWTPDTDIAGLRRDFVRHVFGEAAQLENYYALCEQAYAHDLNLDVSEAKLKGRSTIEETVDDPPADIGSPFNTPDALVGEAQSRQEKAIEAMLAANEVYKPLMTPAGGPPPQAVLREECQRFLLTARLLLRAACLDVRAAQVNGTPRDLDETLKQARFHFINLEKEMRGFVREPYLTNTKLLLWLFLGLSLDAAEDRVIVGDNARKRRRQRRLEAARQNFARAAALWTGASG